MKRYSLLLLLITTFPVQASKYVDDAFPNVIGARNPAMGNAFSGLADDAAAIWYNPGGLTQLSGINAIFHYEDRYQLGIRYDLIGLTKRFDQAVFGFGLQRLNIDDIPDTRDLLFDYGLDGVPNTDDYGEGNGIPDQGEGIDIDNIKFSADQHWQFSFAWSRQQNDKMSIGAVLKVISHDVFDHSAWGTGIDLGVHWRHNDNWRSGIALKNATTTIVAWDTGTKEIANPYLICGAARYFNWDVFSLTVTSDLEMRFDGSGIESTIKVGDISGDFKFGGELSLRNIIALRVGSDAGNFGIGLGFKIAKISLDYAFYTHDILGDTNRFGFRINL